MNLVLSKHMLFILISLHKSPSKLYCYDAHLTDMGTETQCKASGPSYSARK